METIGMICGILTFVVLPFVLAFSGQRPPDDGGGIEGADF